MAKRKGMTLTSKTRLHKFNQSVLKLAVEYDAMQPKARLTVVQPLIGHQTGQKKSN